MVSMNGNSGISVNWEEFKEVVMDRFGLMQDGEAQA